MSFLYLASRSPRRREILSQIGVPHRVLSVDVPELRALGETPMQYVQRLAFDKALAGFQALAQQGLPAAPVLGSDTLGVLDDEVLEKPRDEADAVAMLLRMAGREHSILTAVCLLDEQRQVSQVSETRVRFRAFGQKEASQYWQTGEPADKAGAYGIQGLGAALVEQIEGSYSGVVGLPIETLLPMLETFNIAIWQTELGSS